MICLASLWKKNYRQLANITSPNKQRYANRFAYKTHLVEVPDSSDIMFVKVEVILGAMKALQNDEWVWFTDCDSVITNMGKDVANLVSNYRLLPDENGIEPGIIVANDFNGINSGSMLAKKDSRTIDYLCWILAQNGRVNCEQAAMQETLSGPSHWDGMIRTVPQISLNSYDYGMPWIAACGKVTSEVLKEGQWHEGDLLIHFPATNFQRRLEFCAKYDREALVAN